jgi:hypothetical protein
MGGQADDILQNEGRRPEIVDIGSKLLKERIAGIVLLR